MHDIFISNRRKTSRFILEANARLFIIDENNSTLAEKEIEILNISLEGMKIYFKDNVLMNFYLDSKKNEKRKIKIEFSFEDRSYSFFLYIKWIKIIDNAEKNLLIFSGLCFIEDKAETKENILDILVSLHMNSIYVGNIS